MILRNSSKKTFITVIVIVCVFALIIMGIWKATEKEREYNRKLAEARDTSEELAKLYAGGNDDSVLADGIIIFDTELYLGMPISDIPSNKASFANDNENLVNGANIEFIGIQMSPVYTSKDGKLQSVSYNANASAEEQEKLVNALITSYGEPSTGDKMWNAVNFDNGIQKYHLVIAKGDGWFNALFSSI